jgi:hypothetical protein
MLHCLYQARRMLALAVQSRPAQVGNNKNAGGSRQRKLVLEAPTHNKRCAVSRSVSATADSRTRASIGNSLHPLEAAICYPPVPSGTLTS